MHGPTVTFHDLTVRGDCLYPGDYVQQFCATALTVRNDMGTVRITLDRPSPNGNDNVSVPSDRRTNIIRPIVRPATVTT